MPDTTPAFVPAWTFVAAAEDLARMLVGPEPEPIDDRASLAARLGAIEAQCGPGGAPPATKPDAAAAPTLASVEVGRMAEAVAALRRG